MKKKLVNFGTHFRFKHKNLNIKDYYDKFILKESNLCPICGKERKFRDLYLGYTKTCYNISCRNIMWQRSLQNTLKEQHGVINVSQIPEIKEKIKETVKKVYGCDNVFQSKEIKDKIKCTLLEKYGVENPSLSDEIKNKIHDTTILHFGGIGYASKIIMDKIKQKNLENLGVEFPMQSKSCQNKSKETRYKLYNAYFRLEKWINTCREKYGCDNPMQNHEIFKKTKKKYKFNGLYFDSKPEIYFYKILIDKKINFEYQPKIEFTYKWKNKIYKYNPDFRIGNLFIELKGLHFFENHNPLGKMINPYDRTKDDKYEAKHKCMLDNNVLIIPVTNKINYEDLLNLFNKVMTEDEGVL